MKQIIFPTTNTSTSIENIAPNDIVGMRMGGTKYFFPQIGDNKFRAISIKENTCPNRRDLLVGPLKAILAYYKGQGAVEFYQFETGDELLNWLATHDNV